MVPENSPPPESGRYLPALRVVLALAVGAAILGRSSKASPAALTLWGFYLSTNLLFLFRRGRRLLGKISILFLFDLVILTWLMILSGENRSQFFVSFFLVILLAGLVRSARAAWGVAGTAALVYGLAMGIDHPASLLEMGFTTRLALFFATALFAGYLAEDTHRDRETARRLAGEIQEERKSVHRLQNLYRMLFEEAADGVLLAGPDGSIFDSNPRARELLGRDPRGITYGKLFGMSNTQIVTILREPLPPALPSQGPALMNLDLQRPDGKTVTCEIIHKPFTLDGQPCSLFLLRDVGAVRSLHQRLSDLEKMSILGRLLGSMAHEINNPLSIILGYAEMIQTGVAPPEGLREYISHIREAGERCRRVLNGFLNQYRSHPFLPRDVSLDGLSRRVLELMEFHFRYHCIRVEADLEEGVTIRGDAQQIEQVLVNLLTNAVQAMKDQPRRILRVRVARDPGGPSLTVVDTGCGIPPSLQKRLFEHGMSGKDEGHGLGLFLCREIMNRHGGRIEFSSTPGRTEFVLRFPPPGGPGSTAGR